MSTNNNATNRVGSSRPKQQNYQTFGKGKSHLQKLPIWQRYRRGCIFGGAFLSFLIVYSAPIYQFLRTPPEHIDPRDTMWPSEIAKGKTKAQQIREVYQKRMKEQAEREAAEAAAKSSS